MRRDPVPRHRSAGLGRSRGHAGPAGPARRLASAAVAAFTLAVAACGGDTPVAPLPVAPPTAVPSTPPAPSGPATSTAPAPPRAAPTSRRRGPPGG
ncbi:hypothetical protein E1258_27970, partial [Micromonospora sp. KC207]